MALPSGAKVVITKPGVGGGRHQGLVDPNDIGGGGGGGGSYTLPVATGSVLGGVKIGSGVSVTGDGTISVAGGGGGYVPVPGSPTKFIRYTNTHPGNEDGTNPAVTLYETQPGELFRANVQVRMVVDGVGSEWYTASNKNIGYNQKDINTLLGSTGNDGFVDNDALWDDPWLSATVTYYKSGLGDASNKVILNWTGMSTATSATVYVDLQLSPICPAVLPGADDVTGL